MVLTGKSDGKRKIHILPDDLINKIAAGEVIERPASVVKELVENALDAGSTEIDIALESGGKRLVRVADNGEGMERDQALLALERHATSKISSESDLFSIVTLGFRGEALPSIASVSRLEMITRPSGAESGWRILAEGGRIEKVAECGCPPGTEIFVRDLFFNVPARLKFMSSDSAEMRHNQETAASIALGYPGVSFRAVHGGRTFLDTPAVSNPADRVVSVLGRGSHAGPYARMEFTGDGLSLWGIFSHPHHTRPTSRSIYIFVNGRPVRDRTLMHAILQAYKGILPRGRYPLGALFVDISPSQVDVNVHPAKREVRFLEAGRLHQSVVRALGEAIRRAAKDVGREVSASDAALPGGSTGDEWVKPKGPLKIAPPRRTVPYRPATTPTSIFQEVPLPHEHPAAEGDGESTEPETGGGTVPYGKGFFSSLTYLGQVRGTYLVCHSKDSLVVIDQHAAHERIAYKQLRDGFDSSAPATQQLLFPETVELAPAEAKALESHLEELARTGLYIEPFGGGTFLVTELPAVMAGRSGKAMVEDIADELAARERSKSLDDEVDRVLMRMACHSAVRAGERLDDREVRELLAKMDSIDFAVTCPHGRPVYTTIELSEIEKRMGRT